MKKLCVFCGSSEGKNPIYSDEARKLGKLLVSMNIGLVYGGASWGLMGVLADSMLESGGKVWGIMPEKLVDMEVAHDGLMELHIVKSMHERKQMMYDLSDGFVALPGGIGTLDELCEIVTWAQIGYHHKPCWILNTNGFFDNLIEHFKKVNHEGFVSDEHLQLFNPVSTVEDLLKSFKEKV